MGAQEDKRHFLAASKILLHSAADVSEKVTLLAAFKMRLKFAAIRPQRCEHPRLKFKGPRLNFKF